MRLQLRRIIMHMNNKKKVKESKKSPNRSIETPCILPQNSPIIIKLDRGTLHS